MCLTCCALAACFAPSRKQSLLEAIRVGLKSLPADICPPRAGFLVTERALLWPRQAKERVGGDRF
eukprot:8419979-Alexandrium_andersonii.AAC.1